MQTPGVIFIGVIASVDLQAVVCTRVQKVLFLACTSRQSAPPFVSLPHRPLASKDTFPVHILRILARFPIPSFMMPLPTLMLHHVSPSRSSRYMLVRYEDVARSVERAVENVYRWSGLGEVPTRVSLWIDENTRLHDCADSNNNNHNDIDNGVLSVGANADAVTERGYDAQTAGYSGQAGGGAGKGVSSHRQPSPSECKQKTAERASWDRYGTRRHTAVMAELWRTQMPGDEAMAVWDACTDSRVMDSLGYNQ